MPCVKTCEMEEPVRPAILCCDRPLMNRRPALCFEERYDGIQQLRGKCQITIQNVFLSVDNRHMAVEKTYFLANTVAWRITHFRWKITGEVSCRDFNRNNRGSIVR